MIHFGFKVFDVNWLVGTLRKGIQSREFSTDSRFLHLRNSKSFLCIFFATHTCHFSLSDQNHIQNKQQSDNTLLFNDTNSYSEAEDHQKLGDSMLASCVMNHDMTGPYTGGCKGVYWHPLSN